jgi:hypothetical protein
MPWKPFACCRLAVESVFMETVWVEGNRPEHA